MVIAMFSIFCVLFFLLSISLCFRIIYHTCKHTTIGTIFESIISVIINASILDIIIEHLATLINIGTITMKNPMRVSISFFIIDLLMIFSIQKIWTGLYASIKNELHKTTSKDTGSVINRWNHKTL